MSFEDLTSYRIIYNDLAVEGEAEDFVPDEKWMLESPGCESRNFGDTVWATESKLRIDFGPGYRVYFVIDIDTVDVLFCGGDKTACFEACAARAGTSSFATSLADP